MSIEALSREEWAAVVATRRFGRRPLNPETRALIDLPIGSGLKFPCRWNHDGKGQCSGAATLFHTAHRMGFKVRTHCRDGTLYVWKSAREQA